MTTETNEARRAATVEGIAAVLSEIASKGREADHWERVHLLAAMSHCLNGLYSLAVTECRLSTTPPDERSPHAGLPTGEPYDRLNNARLHDLLGKVSTAPVADRPYFT